MNNIIKIETIEILIQSERPNIIGFQPADFIFSTDNPAPIRNNVSTNNDFDEVVIPCVNILGIGK